MQITIPTNAEDWLRQQAQQAGFADVQDYVLSVVLPPRGPTTASGSRSFYEAAKEAGLIGGGSEFDEELSTNPAHLVGFGE